MTSKQVHVALVVLLAACVAGCGLFPSKEQIVQPRTYPSPYPGPKVWAVVPFRNESGTSAVDGIRVAEQLAAQLQQVNAIQIVPVNRVIAAMEAAGITQVTTVQQVAQLLDTLQVDGVLVGTVTAWEPYDPPKIGVSVALYAASPDHAPPTQPVSLAGSFFDAANGEVLTRLKDYATGRAPSDSPAGWRRYLLSMDLYTEFVSHELMRRLFAAEWQRLTGTSEPGPRNADRPSNAPPPGPGSDARVPSSELKKQ